MDVDATLLAVILTAVVTAAGTFLAARGTRRNTDHARINSLETRVDKLERRNELLVTYAQGLREHIYRGDPPPPPDWPELD